MMWIGELDRHLFELLHLLLKFFLFGKAGRLRCTTSLSAWFKNNVFELSSVLPCYFTAKNDITNCSLLEFYLDDAVF